MKLLTIIFSLLLILLMESCEGYKCGNGKVVDKITTLPLDSVLCEVVTGTQTSVTDSTGLFDLCNPFGGCMPCKDIIIRFSRPGYQMQTVENPTNAIIYLEQ